MFWTYIYSHCTYRNYHDSNAILFDVIVFYSNACLELSMRRALQHRTSTIQSVHDVLMLSVVVDGVMA